jgi:Spy/CpxP family protein refolding chaperone
LSNRFFRLVPAVLVLAGLAASTFAQEAPERRRPARHRFPLCLHVLDLTDEQKAQVSAILEAARPALLEDVAAVASARETLRAALDAEPPDACTIGSAAIAVDEALQALRDGREAVREQLAAILTPEQLARFEGCLDAPWIDGGAGIGDSDDEVVR